MELDDEEPDREIDFEEQQLKKEEIERLKEESRKAKMKNRHARRFGALLVQSSNVVESNHSFSTINTKHSMARHQVDNFLIELLY